MTRTLIQHRTRRLLPALAALTLAAGSLTACSTGAADITAPTIQEADVREDEAPRVEAAVVSSNKGKGNRSGFLLSTGRDEDGGDSDK